MKQNYLYNQMVRLYNRSRSKLKSLTAAGKNLRRQDILKRRIARLFGLLSGMQHALKTGAAAVVLTAGMALFQPNAAQAQITFGPVKENPFGLTSVPFFDAPSYSTFVDLNGDGRLDIMSAAAINNFYYFQNTGTNTAPAFGAPIHNPFGLRDIQSNPHMTFADLDNDGDLDLLIGDWGSPVPFQYLQNTGTPTSPAFAAPILNPFGLTSVGYGNDPAFVDLDNDGDFDLMVGTEYYGDNWGFKYFQNTGTNAAPAFAPVVTNPFGLIPADWSNNPTFADLDGDGDLDMLSGNYWGEFSYYQNTGTNTAPAFAAGVTNPFGLTFPGNRIQPELGDLDNDGDMDLLLTQFDYGNHIWYIENTTCHAATAPTINTPAVNCGLQNNTLTILTGSLNDAAQWVWYSDSCGGNGTNFVGTGTSVTVAQPATTTYFVRGEGGCAPRPGNCGSVTITVNNPATWYIDLDIDGYGNPSISVLACIKPPGYVADSTDCNDGNATIHAPVQYYVDADHDGYGSTTTAMLCTSTAPPGYSTNNTDCNDNDESVLASFQYYVDADLDGYGSTITAMLCSSTAPPGYSTNNSDCNDNDATVLASIRYYIDEDHDGYGSTNTAMLCSSTAPPGYSTNNTDCNDNDATVHASIQYFADTDHDGYGSTTTAMFCSSTAPAGYSTNNTDCNDNDATIHAPLQYYVDADRDGFGSTTTAMLCSSAAPVGYSTNKTDCNDASAGVKPGAPEICGNNIDDNCNGSIDENCNICRMAATVSSGTISCYGSLTTISVNTSGGTRPYKYKLSAGVSFQTNSFFIVGAGTYIITIQDAKGCTKTTNPIIISQPPALTTALNAGTINCFGGATSLTATAGGGTPSYTYKFDYSNYQSSNSFTIKAGLHIATVKDSKGCTASRSIIINHPAVLTASLYIKTPITCYGGSNGSITVRGAGGTKPYTYKINTATAYQSSNEFKNLTPGTYSVTVKDNNGCTAVVTGISLAQPPTVLALKLLQKTNVSCYNGSNGSIKVSADGGTSPYRYSLNGGGSGTSGTFLSLGAGTFTVTAKDANGCTKSITVVVNNGTGNCNNSRSVTSATEADGKFSSEPWLNASVLPNPSETEFTLVLTGNSAEPVELRVIDMVGRMVHQAKGSPNATYKFGRGFTGGMYIIEILQGKRMKTIKIIKI